MDYNQNPNHINLGVITGAQTIDGTLGTSFSFTFGAGNVTLTLQNIQPGRGIDLLVLQDAVGGRTITYAGLTPFPGQAAAAAPAAGANAMTGLRLVNVGSNNFIVSGKA